MNLWMMLLALSFMSPFCGMAVECNYHHAGFQGWALAVGAGLPLGVGFAWILKLTTSRAVEASSLKSQRKGEWIFRAVFIGSLLWIALGLVTGIALYSFAMKVQA